MTVLFYIPPNSLKGFLGGSDGKESTFKESNVGDLGSIPGLRRPPGGGQGHPLQYFCLQNPTERRAWWATVHGVTKSWTQLWSNSSLQELQVLHTLINTWCDQS